MGGGERRGSSASRKKSPRIKRKRGHWGWRTGDGATGGPNHLGEQRVGLILGKENERVDKLGVNMVKKHQKVVGHGGAKGACLLPKEVELQIDKTFRQVLSSKGKKQVVAKK